ncbi:hypothetical protein Dret_0635 [Desulfohalobium retbaense DSM 5692]|uniref:Uncharacterized protein n=1 Tax=Desulfohalobium retbaense (strain ATCC 49708 / DSM 5692 / JCM 16813 / HR100) TaxID=485915 RepID=C8WZ13_DESRD|nr:hypothetical protein Dret_0635 [Desulfohalobium retbaense DSM 5692]
MEICGATKALGDVGTGESVYIKNMYSVRHLNDDVTGPFVPYSILVIQPDSAYSLLYART